MTVGAPARVRLLAALLALVPPVRGGAQELVPLEVRVHERGVERPVAGAQVVVGDSGGSGGLTDAAGAWRGRVAPGRHRVRVRSIGFAPHEGSVRVDAAGAAGGAEYLAALDPVIVPLGAVIVTAARRAQRLADAVVETELLTRRDLERGGASDLGAALVEQTGIQLDGGVPAGAGVQVRGFDSRRVLILVDGQPVAGRINGNFDLSRLSLGSVERVEVVKGPQSILYGSEAMGGVINIITRSAPVSTLDAGLAALAGSHGRREVSAEGGWQKRGLAGFASAGARSIDLAPGIAGQNATYARRWNGSARVRAGSDSTATVDAGAMLVSEEQRYRTGQLFQFSDNTQSAARVTASRRVGLSNLAGTFSASSFEHLSRSSTAAVPATDSGARDRQHLLQAEGVWNGVVGASLIDAGLTLKRESIRADRLRRDSEELTSVEPFAQATIAVGSVSVTPGIRLSWSDRWGSFRAPRLAMLYRPAESLALRASVGRGFRAPDFKELYLEFVNDAAGYAVRGNPDLTPERSTTLSAGAEWTTERMYARGTLFHNDYRDFIETGAPDVSGTYTYDNVSRGWTRGIELEGGVALGAWRLDGGAELLRSRDQATGTPLLGRPSTTVRLRLDAPLSALIRGGVSATYTGSTPIARDASGNISRDRSGFTRVDARLARPLPGGLELSSGVTNLLDRRLDGEWPGFTGRQIYVQLRWRRAAD